MIQMKPPMKQKQNQGCRERLVLAKGEGYGRRMDWEFGISRCKPVYIH